MGANEAKRKSTTITVRLDPELRKEAEFLFESMGTSLSEAVRIFLRFSVKENGFPFPVTNGSYPKADSLDDVDMSDY